MRWARYDKGTGGGRQERRNNAAYEIKYTSITSSRRRSNRPRCCNGVDASVNYKINFCTPEPPLSPSLYWAFK